MDVGNEFATDFGSTDSKEFRPAEAVSGGKDEFAGIEAAFDGGSGINFETPVGDELADQAAFDDRFANERIGIKDVTLFFDH